MARRAGSGGEWLGGLPAEDYKVNEDLNDGADWDP